MSDLLEKALEELPKGRTAELAQAHLALGIAYHEKGELKSSVEQSAGRPHAAPGNPNPPGSGR